MYEGVVGVELEVLVFGTASLLKLCVCSLFSVFVYFSSRVIIRTKKEFFNPREALVLAS